jgi:NAD-dependent SIR2 family protein deacetylase
LEGAVAVGGLSAIGAGLFGMGIPKDSVIKYEAAIKTDKYLLMVHGTSADVAKAKDILAGTGPAELSLHATETVASAAM